MFDLILFIIAAVVYYNWQTARDKRNQERFMTKYKAMTNAERREWNAKYLR